MDRGIGYYALLDKLRLPVHFDVVFVSVMRLVILFRPPSIEILLA